MAQEKNAREMKKFFLKILLLYNRSHNFVKENIEEVACQKPPNIIHDVVEVNLAFRNPGKMVYCEKRYGCDKGIPKQEEKVIEYPFHLCSPSRIA